LKKPIKGLTLSPWRGHIALACWPGGSPVLAGPVQLDDGGETMSDTLRWRGSRRQLLTGGVAAGAGLAGLALVGCGDDDSTAAKPTADISIGFISSFTGPLATVYAPFVNGAKLAIEEINAAGGVLGVKFNLAQADDQSNPANVPAAALGLVDKKVSFCLGPIGSNAISASPTLNTNKIVQFGYSDNPKLSDPKTLPYSFRYVWSPEQSSQLIVDWYKKQGWTKIAILAENTVYGQTDAPSTEAYMKKIGLTPTVFEYFQSGTADFTPLLKKVQDAGSQAIVWWTQGGPEGASVLTSMNSINLKMPIGGIGLYVFGLIGKVSPDILNQAYGFQWKRVTYTDSEKIPEKMIALRDKLQKLDQLGPTGSGLSPFYDMVYHLKAAIEGAKSADSLAVVKWLESHSYEGVTASYKGITDKDHTVTDVSQITLSVLGSFDDKNIPFYKRAPGL
jgi:branched-chain amino acid transport system substrate-binding protein